MRVLIALAALSGGLITAAGAVGAHAIPPQTASWDSAVEFGFVHVLAVLATAALPFSGMLRKAAMWAFMAGVWLFSLNIIVRALIAASSGSAGTPIDFLAPLVPVGGLAFMLGWALLAVSAVLARRPERDAGQD
ncbi:MAG: DUF423 domain-containing protein [Hyphomonadaceae bacterium]